jgi:hypothetical protein
MAPRRNRPGRPQQPHQRLILPQLQWGHDEGVVEVGNIDIHVHTAMLLQWGHDEGVVEAAGTQSVESTRTRSFNGATTKVSWKWICR